MTIENSVSNDFCDKWQSRTLFLTIFDPRSLNVDSVFDRRLPGVIHGIRKSLYLFGHVIKFRFLSCMRKLAQLSITMS